MRHAGQDDDSFVKTEVPPQFHRDWIAEIGISCLYGNLLYKKDTCICVVDCDVAHGKSMVA